MLSNEEVGSHNIKTSHSSHAVAIIIATPGRLLLLTQQHEVSLNSVSFLVLDEADRLLDVRLICIEKILAVLNCQMGFEQVLRELILQMSPARQCLLFSGQQLYSLVTFRFCFFF